MVNTFNDYMIDLLVEKINNKETVLLFSAAFRSHLKKMKDNNIVKKLLSSENKEDFKTSFTYIDLVSGKDDMISYITVPKVVDLLTKGRGKYHIDNITYDILKRFNRKNAKVYKKNRVEFKIGKLINKLFPSEFKPSGDPGNDIESFVNLFKASRDEKDFELVKGDKIVHWYYWTQYAEIEGGSPLHSSCMRNDDSQKFIEYYSDNPDNVSLLILKDSDDSTKIRGRALVWTLSFPYDRIFMDRVYASKDSEVELFKEYAKEQGWMYKYHQNMDADSSIVDTVDDSTYSRTLTVKGMVNNDTDTYPYFDTLKYYTEYGGILSNQKSGADWILEDISGGRDEVDRGTYIDYYDDFLDTEADNVIWCDIGDDYRYEGDCFYSDFYNCYITEDYAESNMEAVDYCYDSSDSYRKIGDYTHLSKYNETVCDDYLNNDGEFVFSDYEDEYFKDNDAVWSDYHNSYLWKQDATEVYIDVQKNETDWRADDDGTWWSRDYDGEDYADVVDEDDFDDQDEDE